MVALPALPQEQITPGDQVVFPHGAVQLLLLAVVHVRPALGGGPPSGGLGAAFESLSEQVEERGAVELALARGGVTEDREELLLAECGGITTEECVGGPPGRLGRLRTVHGFGKPPRQLPLGGAFLRGRPQETVDLRRRQ